MFPWHISLCVTTAHRSHTFFEKGHRIIGAYSLVSYHSYQALKLLSVSLCLRRFSVFLGDGYPG